MEKNSHRDTWDTYTQSWSEADTSKRSQLFAQSLHDDCVYTDPLVQATGYDRLSEYISTLQENIPGVRLETTDFNSHHDRSLAHWNMVGANGAVLGQGASVGMYGLDGRLTQMTGFFPPPGTG
jgi:hypothetical protein